MTHWNQRVIKHIDGTYAIHEAYYDGDKVTSITENAMAPYGMNYAELFKDLEYMMTAMSKPVIDEAKFLKEWSTGAKIDKPTAELVKLLDKTDLGSVEAIKKFCICLEPPAIDYYIDTSSEIDYDALHEEVVEINKRLHSKDIKHFLGDD